MVRSVIKNLIQPAFTLIELVVTIIVIGILSAALAAVYSDLSNSASKAAAKASLAALQSQIAIHFASHQSLPTMQDLQSEVGGSIVGALAIVKGSNIFNILDANENTINTTDAQGVSVPIKIYAYQDAICTVPVVQLSVACGGIAFNVAPRLLGSSNTLSDLSLNNFLGHTLLPIFFLTSTQVQAQSIGTLNSSPDSPDSGITTNVTLTNLNSDSKLQELTTVYLPLNSNSKASGCAQEKAHALVACVELKL